MHPAGSVILFTTLSGAGLGLLAWLSALALLGAAPPTPGFALAAFGLALGLLSLGLVSSTFHLGRPERAWRALTQWRSSWLAREGVAAAAVYLAAVPFAFVWLTLPGGGLFASAAVATLLAATVMVVCTAMIYASLKPIRQWSNRWTAPFYLAAATASGGLLTVDLTLATAGFRPAFGGVATGLIVLAGLVKRRYWRAIDAEAPRSTLASATGLASYGEVRLLEPPHTAENFVMREMGYRIARKHAARLRRLAAAAGFFAPAMLMAAATLSASSASLPLALLATLSAAAGLGVERWLFFAEATHVAMLYYGRDV